MRKTLILLLSIFCWNFLSADISVKSFRKLDNDLDARVNFPIKDQNGDVSAIIKVVTTQKGFSFDGGMTGIVKTIEKPSEIWVYVPWGIKRLSIFHPQLGQLRDYMIPVSVEKATVYEMVLTTGRVVTTVEETIESQWLVITPEPADAAIYIDDNYIKSGVYQAKMKPGNYSYRVEAPLYHTEVGMVEISNAKKELNIKLKPNFGYVTVNSTPESGARVFIDDKPVSKLTPMTTEALKSGEYTVKVMKEMYQPFTQKVLVNDAQTSTINAVLQPNFAELTLNAPLNAGLYINNEKKGNGTWKGRLPAGVFTVEARLAKHRDAKQDIELRIAEVRTVNLQPTPIYGSLDVITEPPGAKISIDGKDYGTTPNTINRLLIGDYTVQLNRQGFAMVNCQLNIFDGETSIINESLPKIKPISIESNPEGAQLFINNKNVGITPYKGYLTLEEHLLRIEKDGKSAEKKIFVNENEDVLNFKLFLDPEYSSVITNEKNNDWLVLPLEKSFKPLSAVEIVSWRSRWVLSKNLRLGYKNFRDKKYAEALNYLGEDKVKISSFSTRVKRELLFCRGYALLETQAYGQASEIFRRLRLQESAYRLDASYYYAYAVYVLRYYETALIEFLKIENEEKYREKVAYYLVQIYNQLNNFAELNRRLDLVITRYPNNPDNAEIYRIKGEIAYVSGNFSQAVEFLKRYESLSSRFLRNDFYMMGISLIKLQRFNAAIPYLQKVTTEKDALTENTYMHLGNAFLRVNDKVNARLAFEAALNTNFDDKVRTHILLNNKSIL